MHHAETEYGFEWSCAKIQRICSDLKKGWIAIGIETPKYEGHEGLQIYITKTGKVRIFDSHGEWKRPNAALTGDVTDSVRPAR